MIQRSLEQAADMAGAILHASTPEAADIQIEGVSTDSRQIQPGMLYIPLIGQRSDGHDFIEQARQKGAAAALWRKDHLPYPDNIPLLLIDDTLQAMQQLAKSYLAQLDPFTIGITGSNGKTSTKDMMAAVFENQGKTQKTQGNHNNEIGLPLTILEFDEDIEYAVLEMGMENYGEILDLVHIAPLDLAVIVSIGSAHMENFGDKNGIAAAKMEIAQGLKEGGVLIWNGQSEELQRIMQTKPLPAGIKSISFGADGIYTVESAVSYTSDGIEFQTGCFEQPLRVHAIGDYQAMNALAVTAAAQSCRLEEQQIRKGLENVQLTRMRSALYPAKHARILDDTYKSNPESAKSALETLMKIPGEKHVAVLADMLDLGETTIQLHAGIGRAAKEMGVDALYTWGPLSVHTAEAFGKNGRHYESRETLMEDLKPWLEQDAVLLIKGSRAMKMDEVAAGLLEESSL